MSDTLPQFQINTEGFHLRAFKMTDAEDYSTLLKHPEVAPFIPKDNIPSSIFDALRTVKLFSSLSARGSGAYWALCTPESKLIGACGFDTHNQFHKRLDLVFELHPDYQKRGLMTAALTPVIHYGFTTLKAIRIQATTLTHNQASIALLGRKGFKREGILKHYRMFNNEPVDIAMFGLTPDDA